MIVAAAVFLIFVIEGLYLGQKRMWKELAMVVVLLSAAVFLQVSYKLGMLTPIDLIWKLLEPIGKTFFNNI